MKSIVICGLFAFLALPPVRQITEPPAERCDTAKFQFNEFGKFVSLVWRRPAVFPEPSKAEIEHTFSFGCRDYSALVSDGTFHIVGHSTLEAAYRRLDDVKLVEVSGCVYPNIRVDCYDHYLKIVFAPSSVTVAPDSPYDLSFTDAVVGAKVNDGDLTPLYFEAKATLLSFQQSDRVDIFVKARLRRVSVPRITIDARNREIDVYASATFPEK